MGLNTTLSHIRRDSDGNAIDPFHVVVVRGCGCTVWRFEVDPIFGLVPWPGVDPMRWLPGTIVLHGHALRTMRPPVKGPAGPRYFPGSRGPSGRRDVPVADVEKGELVLRGRNLCPHARRDNAPHRGWETHPWRKIAAQLAAAIAQDFDPRWPVEVKL